VFVANPNNPTGTWAPTADVKALLERAPPSTLVLLDEAYFEYGHERGTQDGTLWLADHPNLVVIRTFSKAYGLAGARVGYAVSHPEVAETLNRLRPAFNVNSVAQAGAAAALADQAHMRQTVLVTMRELARVEAALHALGLWCAPSACNFLLVHLGAAAQRIYEGLLRVGLIVRPVGGYGLGEYLRVSIGLPAENDRLLRELAALLR
jgi:histidinol-phosphate aminotransferase